MVIRGAAAAAQSRPHTMLRHLNTTTMLAAVIALLAVTAGLVNSQSLYSHHPSRSTILAASRRGPVEASNHTRNHPDLSELRGEA